MSQENVSKTTSAAPDQDNGGQNPDGHSHYEQNLVLLRENHPQVWQAVQDYRQEAPGRVVPAADGCPNLVLPGSDGGEIYFHDRRDTSAELASYYALVPEGATGVAAFVGMGLGYTPVAMLADRPQLRHLLVFEPETGLFIQALKNRDLTTLLTDPRVRLAVGPEIEVEAVLSPLARVLQLESIHVLQHAPCFRAFPDTYRRMHERVFSIGNSFNLGGNTTMAYGAKFIDNRLRHLTAIQHQCLLERLKGAFAGVPAILVSGGPSLDKNIHLLPQAKDKAVIIAVDSALPALMAHGVTPDFTGCIDMVDLVLEKVIDVADQPVDTALVCSSWVNTKVPKVFPARQVHWTFTGKNMEKWINNLLGGKLTTSGAATVAQLNFTAAVILGCSPIIFVGQDLAYSDDKSHAGHTSLAIGGEHAAKLTASKDSVMVDAYGGRGQIRTSRSFLGFKYTFEQNMATLPQFHFINATEGGVRLEGAEEMPLARVVEQFCTAPREVATTIKAAEQGDSTPRRRRLLDEFGRTLKETARVEKDLATLDRLVVKVEPEIEKMRQQQAPCGKYDLLPRELKKPIRELDEVNQRLDGTRLWGLLDEATMEGLRLSDRLNHELSQLAGDPARYLDWLAKNMERFRVINRFRRRVLSPFADRLRQVHEHLKREGFLLDKLAKAQAGGKGKGKGKNKSAPAGPGLGELLELYYQSGDLMLLEKTLAAHGIAPPSTADTEHDPAADDAAPAPAETAPPALAAFYHGAIAAHRSLFDRAEQYFAAAERQDPALGEKIVACRRALADHYIDAGRYFKQRNPAVARRLWLKAARFSPALPELVKQLGKEVKEAEFQLQLADLAFNRQEFPAGVAALDQAVALDRDCARNWETIGDTLLAAGQAEDALAAYEKCFTALPQAVEVLKKIGDCYQALNQPEAALEAYQQLAQRLSGSGTESV
ncbi:6-hydroxymethylpterin diphosphokinase MptE-like protein [Desulfurivibrio dismutans]|uniref:6-hydroxymethylpterin diphosphokinase MptE-like protein n=1 Tax=Desulfurivibrio dismutans TaxID=1398908 RepID=UPI0023DC46E5|nr:6-hydroxymethylpterin diphosphokinase MptE-like protein [Desulfurivibrio alkaliphilus]MDF1613507.1 DUF115 domain-containing protein [Desulfurivibrio alkaliphilus]